MGHTSSHEAVRQHVHFSWRDLLLAGSLAILLYVVVPQFATFRHSLSLLRSASWLLLSLAVFLEIATFFVAAFVLWVLAVKPVRYSRSLIVQGASGFTNRLLPAGLGGMGIKAAFLHRSRHTTVQATGVAIMNNALGFVGHFVLLAIVLIVYPASQFHIGATSKMWALRAAIAVVVLAVMATIIYASKLFVSARRKLAALGHTFKSYSTRIPALLAGLLGSVGITVCNMAIFFVCAHALGSRLSIADVVIISTVGMAAAAVTPTPGGLGGVEAGLVAGMVGFGSTDDVALAAVLLYRLLTYWLPIVPGLLLFHISLRRKYV
ncbi:MAG TPA: lysylphosphatidylglycerol synthase transmembrane domain-containing protein [Candidatus Saccharimonadales bacterium]|nr:lysylphosphatidylglycerol synthase transmembrane domain-containing protein [Candidatus Saccharimonadales bacterium]